MRSSALSNALSRPWPKGELLIGQAIGVPPSTIWPGRYFNSVTMAFVERPLRPAYKRAATSE
ncbi:helix-turn-helix domain-containing protein [Rahnella aceris]|uniref:helix-turn-helix domain-containing protein n=1 Tax=Rahnella sp. (strain Y9602) TaxID=2703885 RepID=UPI001902D5D1|nr:helix-turn-helix domain-containing protein [Rahnella aceris]QQN37170.1 helix-turn-helix domain-containing protein [Rahnella aceris]